MKEEIKVGDVVVRRASSQFYNGIFGKVVYIRGEYAGVKWNSQTGTRAGKPIATEIKIKKIKLKHQ